MLGHFYSRGLGLPPPQSQILNEGRQILLFSLQTKSLWATVSRAFQIQKSLEGQWPLLAESQIRPQSWKQSAQVTPTFTRKLLETQESPTSTTVTRPSLNWFVSTEIEGKKTKSFSGTLSVDLCWGKMATSESGTREKGQQLRALAALWEDPDWVSSLLWEAHNCL